ncbi:MAG: hypothetical protein ABI696_16365 [Rubrivivax sp.]
MQPSLFEAPALPAAPAAAALPAAVVPTGLATPRRRRADADTLQRWWRLQGRARRSGQAVEPLLVTPDFLARIDVPCCPVTREPIGRSTAQVLPLRADASAAAGHLAAVGARAAAAPAGQWSDAWAEAERRGNAAARPPGAVDPAAALDGRQWRRLALLRAFVSPLTPSQAAVLPLLVLPPPRLRVLSPVQGLQVALTLALQAPQRASVLGGLADGLTDADRRQALRVFVLTLLARCPSTLGSHDTWGQRHALEDLWDDPLLARRWERLALRLDDAAAEQLLMTLQRALGGTRRWRTLPTVDAVDGWDLPANAASVAPQAPRAPNRRRARRSSAAFSTVPAVPAVPAAA